MSSLIPSWLRAPFAPALAGGRRRPRVPALECLESRLLLSAFPSTALLPSGPGAVAGGAVTRFLDEASGSPEREMTPMDRPVQGAMAPADVPRAASPEPEGMWHRRSISAPSEELGATAPSLSTPNTLGTTGGVAPADFLRRLDAFTAPGMLATDASAAPLDPGAVPGADVANPRGPVPVGPLALEDLQNQADFQRRLDSFTSQGDTPAPVPTAVSVQGFGLALVATGVAVQNAAGPAAAPHPDTANAPAPSPPAAADIRHVNFVSGVAEAMARQLTMVQVERPNTPTLQAPNRTSDDMPTQPPRVPMPVQESTPAPGAAQASLPAVIGWASAGEGQSPAPAQFDAGIFGAQTDDDESAPGSPAPTPVPASPAPSLLDTPADEAPDPAPVASTNHAGAPGQATPPSSGRHLIGLVLALAASFTVDLVPRRTRTPAFERSRKGENNGSGGLT